MAYITPLEANIQKYREENTEFRLLLKDDIFSAMTIQQLEQQQLLIITQQKANDQVLQQDLATYAPWGTMQKLNELHSFARVQNELLKQMNTKVTKELAEKKRKLALNPQVAQALEALRSEITALQEKKQQMTQQVQMRLHQNQELLHEKERLLQLVNGTVEDVYEDEYGSPHSRGSLTTSFVFVRKTLKDPLWTWGADAATVVGTMAFSRSGAALVALCEDGVHRYWKYCPHLACVEPTCNEPGFSAAERLWSWHPKGVSKMAVATEGLSHTTPKALLVSRNERYLLSMTGGAVFLYDLVSYELHTLLHRKQKAATSVAFHPSDNNIVAIGLADGSLQLVHVNQADKELLASTRKHNKPVTSIVFVPLEGRQGEPASRVSMQVLTGGKDGKLVSMKCTLDSGSGALDLDTERYTELPLAQEYEAYKQYDDVHMELNEDGVHLLVSHPNQICVYNAKTLHQLESWFPAFQGTNQVGRATFSSCSRYVYAHIADGSIMVFSGVHKKAKALKPICRFVAQPLEPGPGGSGSMVQFLVPHPHPDYSSCFALAMADGSVQIWKPAEAPNAAWEALADAARVVAEYTESGEEEGGMIGGVVTLGLEASRPPRQRGGGGYGGSRPGTPKKGWLGMDVGSGRSPSPLPYARGRRSPSPMPQARGRSPLPRSPMARSPLPRSPLTTKPGISPMHPTTIATTTTSKKTTASSQPPDPFFDATLGTLVGGVGTYGAPLPSTGGLGLVSPSMADNMDLIAQQLLTGNLKLFDDALPPAGAGRGPKIPDPLAAGGNPFVQATYGKTKSHELMAQHQARNQARAAAGTAATDVDSPFANSQFFQQFEGLAPVTRQNAGGVYWGPNNMLQGAGSKTANASTLYHTSKDVLSGQMM